MKSIRWKDYGYVLAGSVLFSLSVNLFIVPLGLYNGGIIGYAQLIRTFLVQKLQLDLSFDIAGIINLLLNIPLFILAYKGLSRHFLIGTVIAVLMQSILMAIIPIPSTLLLDDKLAMLIIGGALGAFGAGLTLTAECSLGGADILGMWASQNSGKISVGRLSILLNVTLYSLCAILFDISTAVYSIIYAFIFGLVEDHFHLQNIEIGVLIFTKQPEEMISGILHQFHRGVTKWNGEGAYTHQAEEILYVVISKYELDNFKKYVRDKDPNAFIVQQEGIHVSGGFEKRLIRENSKFK